MALGDLALPGVPAAAQNVSLALRSSSSSSESPGGLLLPENRSNDNHLRAPEREET